MSHDCHGASRKSSRARLRGWAHSLVFVCGVSLLTPALHAQGEPREPGPGATPHKIYQAQSKGGLRYTWAIPKKSAPEGERALTILLHGTGLDYRWGLANHTVGKFRPLDVLVSVDGTSPGQGESRLFLDKKQDLEAFHAFVIELRSHFAVDRVFLYGHSQGGFFVALFAGEFPDDVAGVVAHASGAWSGSKTTGGVRDVPMVFLHGSADPVVPYSNSTGSHAHYRKQGLDLARLRRLPGYNHWPNEVRAAECITWCEGMVTQNPAVAIACAEELLRPKGLDGVQYQMPVDYSGAQSVLERFSSKSKRKFDKGGKKGARQAKALLGKIDGAAKEHLKKIQKGLRKGLVLDGEAWLGHLLEMREDFRGVPAFEDLLRKLKFEERSAEHLVAARRALKPWYAGKPPKEIYAAAVKEIRDAFLFDQFPAEYGKQLKLWHEDAATLEIAPSDYALFPRIEAWIQSIETGKKEYAEIWKRFKG